MSSGLRISIAPQGYFMHEMYFTRASVFHSFRGHEFH